MTATNLLRRAFGQQTTADLAGDMQQQLHRLIDVWFPTVVDTQYGGFHCDFDHRWRRRESGRKMLEYQARTLRFAARAAISFPELAPIVEHGFRFLADAMWDSEYGGWFRMVDRSGKPLENSVKHAHGMAYAISACTWVYRLSGNEEALTLAYRGFDWLENFAHDETLGGYYSFFERDGAQVQACMPSRDRPLRLDPLGNPVGYKESNTTVDMLETLGELVADAGTEAARERLEEILSIVLNYMVVEPGAMHLIFRRDWRPVPHLTNYAHCLQTARTIADVGKVLNFSGPEHSAYLKAKALVDNMLAVAWDTKHGGFHHAGWAGGKTLIEGCPVYVPDKTWWCQAEGLRALRCMNLLYPDLDYADMAGRSWEYIKAHVIDVRNGGWREKGTDSVRYDRRAPKANIWKDPSHEGAALLVACEARASAVAEHQNATA
jgi:mannobiose 2-epimerase